jgi:hypothetical protein
MFVRSYAFISLCGLLLISLTRAAPDATGCAAIAQYQASAVAQASPLGIPVVSVNLPASVAHDCLISIPLNATDASAFIDYYRTYLNFQSILAFLKDPPASYQQPAVDLLGGLDIIQADDASGRLKKQYDFETAVLSWSMLLTTDTCRSSLVRTISSSSALAVICGRYLLPLIQSICRKCISEVR